MYVATFGYMTPSSGWVMIAVMTVSPSSPVATAGAMGYLLKDSVADEVVQEVRAQPARGRQPDQPAGGAQAAAAGAGGGAAGPD